MADNPFAGPQENAGQQGTRGRNRKVGPVGLGGWLILVVIGLFGSLLLKLKTLMDNIQVLGTPDWDLLTTPGNEAYDPMWAPTIYFEIVVLIVALMLNGVVLYLFFARKSAFKTAFIIFALLNLGISVVDAVLCSMISNFPKEGWVEVVKAIFQSGVYAAIWIAYMVKSVRVRNTFVN